MLMSEVGSSRDVRARPALVRECCVGGSGSGKLVFVTGGDGRVPCDAAGDDHVQPAQQRGRAGCSGLLAGQPVVLPGGEVVEPAARTGLFGSAVHTARQAASRSSGRPRQDSEVLP